MTAKPETAVAVIEQNVESGLVEWNLDGFPEADYNRLVPVATLQLPTDLLRPVVQIVRLSPNPQDGDVYSSRDMPEGHSAPTRVGLRKFATAAGISFIDERRVDDGSDPDVIEVTCLAEMLLPTGQRIHATGTKRIDLNAQVWRSPEHRGKFKSFFQEHVASRAQNRAIRALLSLRGSYPTSLYNKPFAVVSFAPNMNHPDVRARVLDAMAGASAQLYGGSQAKQLAAPATINVTPAAEEDPAPTPETPTVLPGEKLAAAASTDDLPDFLKPGEPPAETEAKAEPEAETKPVLDIIDKLQGSAERSRLKNAITDPQKDRLKSLFVGHVSGGDFAAVIGAAFGDEFVSAPTAAQAQAIITLAESFGGDIDAFHEAWRAAAAQVRGEAA